MSRWIFCFCLMFATPAFARVPYLQPHFTKHWKVQPKLSHLVQLHQTLQSVKKTRIASRKVFEGGVISLFYRHRQVLMRLGNQSMFLSLLQKKNKILRAMGLVSLARLKTQKARQAIQAMRKDKTTIFVQDGCEISRSTLGKLATALLKNPRHLD